jgi:hypothetical protein
MPVGNGGLQRGIDACWRHCPMRNWMMPASIAR